MRHEFAASPYRQIYALLLRCYPRAYRERFGEELGQTFNDLCRERADEGKGLFGFMLWVFSDTFIGIISVRISFIFSFLVMHAKHVLRPALAALTLLLIPFTAMFITDEVNWDETDFIIMGLLIFTVTFIFELLTLVLKTKKQRVIAGVILAFLFLYIWAELAVGIFNIPGISGS